MAQISYRANLSAAIFPLTLAQAGRSVIIPGPDNTYDRRVDPEGEQKNAGIPQAIYLENVIPTSNGYQSVGSLAMSNILPGGSTASIGIILTVRNSLITTAAGAPSSIYLAFATDGVVYCNYTDLSVAWQAATTSGIDPWPPAPAGVGPWPPWYPPASVIPTNKNQVSIATVRGITYLFAEGTFYEIEFTGGTPVVNLADVTGTMTGLASASDIGYIASAYNYLILLDNVNDQILWSSTTTPNDFTVSLITGAGSAKPNSMNTKPFFLTETPKGFLIYCAGGIISAQYTGNSRYPWKFSPVAGAGGHSYAENVANIEGSEEQFVIDDSNKIFVVNHQQAQLIAPEVSDWTSRIKTVDSYNQTTHTFSIAQLVVDVPLYIRIHDVMNRYVLVSYSTQDPITTAYTGCVVYDRLLKRYGRITIAHNYIVSENADLFFISRDGTVKRVIFDIYAKDYLTTADFSSVIVLGKFQYVRSRLIGLDEIEVESVQSTDVISTQDFQIRVLPSIDGKNFDAAITPVAVTDRSDGPLNTYNCRVIGRNVSLVLMGAFDLSSVQLIFHPEGGR